MIPGNILVADDDAAIRTVLSQALSRAGHEVRVTSSASTLWRWVASGDGDLVITDVVMPDENAFDMLPRIKKARPELPVEKTGKPSAPKNRYRATLVSPHFRPRKSPVTMTKKSARTMGTGPTGIGMLM